MRPARRPTAFILTAASLLLIGGSRDVVHRRDNAPGPFVCEAASSTAVLDGFDGVDSLRGRIRRQQQLTRSLSAADGIFVSPETGNDVLPPHRDLIFGDDSDPTPSPTEDPETYVGDGESGPEDNTPDPTPSPTTPSPTPDDGTPEPTTPSPTPDDDNDSTPEPTTSSPTPDDDNGDNRDGDGGNDGGDSQSPPPSPTPFDLETVAPAPKGVGSDAPTPAEDSGGDLGGSGDSPAPTPVESAGGGSISPTKMPSQSGQQGTTTEPPTSAPFVAGGESGGTVESTEAPTGADVGSSPAPSPEGGGGEVESASPSMAPVVAGGGGVGGGETETDAPTVAPSLGEIWEPPTPKYFPTQKPTPHPTVEYIGLTDDPFMEETDAPSSSPKTAIEKAEALEKKAEELAKQAKLEAERMEADRNVRIVAGVLSALLVVVWLLTAHQMLENPNGLCAKLCRCILLIVCFILRTLCLPCRYMCCRQSVSRARDRRMRQPVGRPDDFADLELT